MAPPAFTASATSRDRDDTLRCDAQQHDLTCTTVGIGTPSARRWRRAPTRCWGRRVPGSRSGRRRQRLHGRLRHPVQRLHRERHRGQCGRFRFTDLWGQPTFSGIDSPRRHHGGHVRSVVHQHGLRIGPTTRRGTYTLAPGGCSGAPSGATTGYAVAYTTARGLRGDEGPADGDGVEPVHDLWRRRSRPSRPPTRAS